MQSSFVQLLLSLTLHSAHTGSFDLVIMHGATCAVVGALFIAILNS